MCTSVTANTFYIYLLLICFVATQVVSLPFGEYAVTHCSIKCRGILDRSGPKSVIVYPKVYDNNSTISFPLLVFSHGIMSGGSKTYRLHKGFLDGLASFGFIVVAIQSCNWGCPGFLRWDTYDIVIIKLLEYIDSEKGKSHAVLKHINRSHPIGLVGHSMGGRATAQVLEFAHLYNIMAGVILHPVGDGTVTINVPTAVFTGTKDIFCGEHESQTIYRRIMSSSRAYANMIGARHTEPNFGTKWNEYVSAWFKIHLNDETVGYFYNLIYGNETKSLCNGIDTPMVKSSCEAF